MANAVEYPKSLRWGHAHVLDACVGELCSEVRDEQHSGPGVSSVDCGRGLGPRRTRGRYHPSKVSPFRFSSCIAEPATVFVGSPDVHKEFRS